MVSNVKVILLIRSFEFNFAAPHFLGSSVRIKIQTRIALLKMKVKIKTQTQSAEGLFLVCQRNFTAFMISTKPKTDYKCWKSLIFLT